MMSRSSALEGLHHHWDRLSSFVRLDLAQNLDAVDLRHLQVEEHQLRGSIRSRGVDATAKEEVERFGTSLTHTRLLARFLRPKARIEISASVSLSSTNKISTCS
jgi:hypothetical protein